MNAFVSITKDGALAIVTIDNPPVNALSSVVRSGLLASFGALRTDTAVKGVVLRCAGKTFAAGADIKELDSGNTSDADPNDVHRLIEFLDKPVVAAIHGNALGGGLELALSCHYRVAQTWAKVGLPEVTLGLIPGAGGTQRSVRLMGAAAALDMMLSGLPLAAPKAKSLGLLDRLTDGDPLIEAKALLEELLQRQEPLPHACDKQAPTGGDGMPSFATLRADVARKSRSPCAAVRIVDCVEAATTMPFEQGLQFERTRFLDCLGSAEAAALKWLFFAEREAARVPNLPEDTKLRNIASVGVVGAGTMGGGIAMNFLNAGIPVRLLEANPAALERGLGLIRKNYEITAARGKLTPEKLDARMALLKGTLEYGDLSDCDLVIEAVFENLEVKKGVLAGLAKVCKQGAIMATNTSTLDVDALASATGRPQDVLGMHFFSPANVMRLLEVVRGAETASDAMATVMKTARTIGKVAVVSGVCYGFIGNRMLEGYVREAQSLLLEGASPDQVDGALEAFGMAMGPLRMCDMAGLDVRLGILDEWHKRGGMPRDPTYRTVIQAMNAKGRHGQKTGLGFYRYEGRNALPDPEADAILSEAAAAHGITRRSDIEQEEIVKRCLYPLINEGAKILEEGIAYRPGDIDVVWTNGYGFPARRGGPMHMADTLGLRQVVEEIAAFAQRFGNDYGYWMPSALLQKLAATGSRFADLKN